MRHQLQIMLQTELLPPAAPPPKTVRPKTARGTPEEADIDQVRRRLWRIGVLLKTGLLVPAREACADLLFDFQPLIASNPDLLAAMLVTLEQCGATALRRRLVIAVHGEADELPRDPVGSLTTRS
jgi:hypothetical protein